MLRTEDSETEILLGNKQLLAIFFVVAILLGVAFTGGYMMGRNSSVKKAALPGPALNETASSNANPAGGETHSLPADSTDTAASSDRSGTASNAGTQPANPGSTANKAEEPPLGSPERKIFEEAHPTDTYSSAAAPDNGFVPEAGQEFLQVGAVGRDEAEAIADVLHKKGFRAHAVPKPGNPKLYRVLIGPIQDAADLSTTRDSLRKTGFREVIVQKY